ncbi:hypothetical protein MMC18_002859 [Xylographa bjoerkii]|nr:hypothetical protein [Xylographa bjoerkii]
MPEVYNTSAWYSTGKLKAALTGAGLKELKSEIVTVHHVHDSRESFLEKDREKVKWELEKMVRGEPGDGNKLYIDSATAVGRTLRGEGQARATLKGQQ